MLSEKYGSALRGRDGSGISDNVIAMTAMFGRRPDKRSGPQSRISERSEKSPAQQLAHRVCHPETGLIVATPPQRNGQARTDCRIGTRSIAPAQPVTRCLGKQRNRTVVEPCLHPKGDLIGARPETGLIKFGQVVMGIEPCGSGGLPMHTGTDADPVQIILARQADGGPDLKVYIFAKALLRSATIRLRPYFCPWRGVM
jgi:hypothetical protein